MSETRQSTSKPVGRKTNQIHHEMLTLNGIQMHYATAGEGPLLLLLHDVFGFWYSWRHQLAALSHHYRVVAPDLRGCNDTDKPAGGYEADMLLADVVELMRHLGYDRALVAGQGWGGLLAWGLASCYPHRVERLMLVHTPHPALFSEPVGNGVNTLALMGQRLLSAFFRLPWLPEAVLQANDYALAMQLLLGPTAEVRYPKSIPDGDGPEPAIEAYKDALSKPQGVKAALAWYRAIPPADVLRAGLPGTTLCPSPLPVAVPTLLLWGEEATPYERTLARRTRDYVAAGQESGRAKEVVLPGCSRWMLYECPEAVSHAMAAFLAEQPEEAQGAQKTTPFDNEGEEK